MMLHVVLDVVVASGVNGVVAITLVANDTVITTERAVVVAYIHNAFHREGKLFVTELAGGPQADEPARQLRVARQHLTERGRSKIVVPRANGCRLSTVGHRGRGWVRVRGQTVLPARFSRENAKSMNRRTVFMGIELAQTWTPVMSSGIERLQQAVSDYLLCN